MDFSFNEEQASLGDTIAQMLADFPALTGPELVPADDDAVWNALAELGLFSLLVPEPQGGVGLTLVDCALAIEALGRGLAPPLVASTLIATEVIVRCLPGAVRQNVLGPVSEGQKRIALAVAETGQKDPFDTGCQLVGGRLTGRKIAVPGALAADLFLVLAQHEGKPCVVLVDAAAAGVSRVAHETLDPSASLGAVTFADVEILDASSAASAGAEWLLDVAATVEAGLAMGMAGSAFDRTVDYAKTRQQFGQAIGAFQTIKHRCADMAVALEAGRATAYYAFWACGTGTADQSQRASSAKAYCTEIARDICNDAIQIHGGMGFTWELGLHRYLRRVKIVTNSLGGASWHYERVYEKSRMVEPVVDAHRDAA